MMVHNNSEQFLLDFHRAFLNVTAGTLAVLVSHATGADEQRCLNVVDTQMMVCEGAPMTAESFVGVYQNSVSVIEEMDRYASS